MIRALAAMAWRFFAFDGGTPTPTRLRRTVLQVEELERRDAPAALAADPPGLEAFYYKNTNLSGQPAVVEINKDINYTWVNTKDQTVDKTPAAIGRQHDFSVIWQGEIKAPVTGEYKFDAYTDDGARLWVNGVPLVNDFSDHKPEPRYGSIKLEAGKEYPIFVEYYENDRGAAISQLYWSGTFTQGKEVIVPAADLSHHKLGAVEIDQLTVGQSIDDVGKNPGGNPQMVAKFKKYIQDGLGVAPDARNVREARSVVNVFTENKNVVARFYHALRYKVPHLNDGSIIQVVHIVIAYYDAQERVLRIPGLSQDSTFVEGWKTNENGVAVHGDSHSSELILPPGVARAVRTVTYTVGVGLYNGQPISGPFGAQAFKGAGDGPDKVTWLQKPKEYTNTFALAPNGRWNWVDEGLNRRGDFNKPGKLGY